MSEPAAPTTITVVSCNVMADLREHAGFERWPARRERFVDALQELDADLIGVQECLFGQQDDLIERMPGFAAVRCDLSGADEALRAQVRTDFGIDLPLHGELMILYRRATFDLVQRREGWLSPTPERVSTGFGARDPRSLLAAELRHVASGRAILVANTRLDHRCAEPMARVALDLLRRWAGDHPAVWMGDFNAGLDAPAGRLLQAAGWVAPATRDDAFRGARTEHIWRRGLALAGYEVIDATAYTPILSDHDPLRARLAWADDATAARFA